MTTTTAEDLPQPAAADAESRPLRGHKKRLQIEQRNKAIVTKAAGVRNADLALLFATQMGAMQPGSARSRVQSLVDGVGLLQEMEPQNATEAMLAIQMSGVHNAAVKFLRRATLPGQTLEGSDTYAALTTRLMRLFNDQVETMAKLKGKTRQQKVTVEHVHVHSGGQAVVGLLEESSKGKEVE